MVKTMDEESNHWIIREIPRDILDKADEMINEKKFEKKIFGKSSLTRNERELLERVLEVYELALLDLWANEEKKHKFSEFSKKCFDILQVFPIPSNEILKIKHVLRLVSYSYLGEKWADGRRFLIEEENVWKLVMKDDSWDEVLFKKTYLAILYLIRKNSWEDLRKAIDLINELRKEQKNYEMKYLDSVEFDVED